MSATRFRSPQTSLPGSPTALEDAQREMLEQARAFMEDRITDASQHRRRSRGRQVRIRPDAGDGCFETEASNGSPARVSRCAA